MMMHRFRLPAVAVVSALALLLSSCGSGNKGKIEGRWKVTSLSKKDKADDMAQAMSMGLAMVFEFHSDSTFQVTFVAEKPEAEPMVKAIISQPEMAEMKGTYSLGSGDTVNFSGAKSVFKPDGKGTSRVTISGDNMTMTDKDGTVSQLTRMPAK